MTASSKFSYSDAEKAVVLQLLQVSMKHSLRETVNQDNCCQTPSKQEHHQEKEGGGGRTKRPQRWPTVLEECYLRGEKWQFNTGLGTQSPSNVWRVGGVKARASPSCSKTGWQTSRCWWRAAEGKKELPPRPQSDHKPGQAHWREPQTPAAPPTEQAYRNSYPPQAYHIHKKTLHGWTQDWLTSIQIYSMHLHDVH